MKLYTLDRTRWTSGASTPNELDEKSDFAAIHHTSVSFCLLLRYMPTHFTYAVRCRATDLHIGLRCSRPMYFPRHRHKPTEKKGRLLQLRPMDYCCDYCNDLAKAAADVFQAAALYQHHLGAQSILEWQRLVRQAFPLPFLLMPPLLPPLLPMVPPPPLPRAGYPMHPVPPLF